MAAIFPLARNENRADFSRNFDRSISRGRLGNFEGGDGEAAGGKRKNSRPGV